MTRPDKTDEYRQGEIDALRWVEVLAGENLTDAEIWECIRARLAELEGKRDGD